MGLNLSNQIKALAFYGDLTSANAKLHRDEAVTLQNYYYRCVRSRNALGFPYGNPHSMQVEFTVRNFSVSWEKNLLEIMKSNETHSFSFIFNGVFNESRRLEDFDDALILRGFVVDMEHIYDNYQEENSTMGQRLMKIKLLLSNIVYKGEYADRKLEITNE